MKRFANNNRSPRSRQRGLSLVELMVALLIGLILTAGVISVYLTSKKSYNVDTGLAQVQENGRFALSFMEPVLRMAGYEGCTRASPENFLNGSVNGSYSDVAYNFSNPIQGYEYIGGAANTDVNGSYTVPSTIAADTSVTADWSPSIPTSISGEISGYAIPGSDILVTHEAAGLQLSLVDPYQDSAGVFVSATDAAKLAIGQIVVVSDCQKSVLFQLSNVNTSSGRVDHSQASQTPGNSASTFGYKFGKGSKISVAETFVYFIGLSKTDLTPALFEVAYNASGANIGQLGAPQELVPNIENMQVLYGVDTDGDKVPNQFVDASVIDAAGEWSKVVAVRIALLARSDDLSTDAAPASAPTYDLNNVTITTPQDRRLRKVFVQTIGLRNMLP